jgi:hypothetical protein
MNCSECQDLLSEFIDEELSENKRAFMQMHIDSCNECCAIFDDLSQIVSVSKELPLLSPENALWSKIEDEIRELKALPAQKQRTNTWTRFWNYRLHLSLSMPQIAGVICLVMMLSLAATFTYLPEKSAIITSTPIAYNHSTIVARPLANVMNPEEAELYSAIDRTMQTVNRRRAKWDPQLQTLFERNLAIVDRSVSECKQMVLRNPDDQIAHEMMMIAYKEKLRLLEQFSTL